MTKKYELVVSKNTMEKVKAYLQELQSNPFCCGGKLSAVLSNIDLSNISEFDLLRFILSTKSPQIFAESEVQGDGRDWTLTELSILGDVGTATEVFVYDNGLHYDPIAHKSPFKATLMYIPGALLRSRTGTPADWNEVTEFGSLNYKAYFDLYERRLMPLFFHINEICEASEKNAIVTIPGLGCGQFAGPFRGTLGARLQSVLFTILEKYSSRLKNIRAVYFDPYSECINSRSEIEHISFLTRPLSQGNSLKAQLCKPSAYEDEGDSFSDCDLFSFVAWDHVSWPGNDFYIGSRMTDDGVKAAATNTMMAMTGIEGQYERSSHRYNPPSKFSTWNEVVVSHNLQFGQDQKIYVYEYK